MIFTDTQAPITREWLEEKHFQPDGYVLSRRASDNQRIEVDDDGRVFLCFDGDGMIGLGPFTAERLSALWFALTGATIQELR